MNNELHHLNKAKKMSEELSSQFHHAMVGLHTEWSQLSPPYHAKLFLRMVNDHGGKETADRLLASAKPSEGLAKLFLRGKAGLSVESLVLDDKWSSLFTTDQLSVAKRRLGRT